MRRSDLVDRGRGPVMFVARPGSVLTANLSRLQSIRVGIPHMSYCERQRAGHWPTLLCAFLYLDASFMVWVMLGALGNALSDAFGLSPGQKGLMVALPILAGAAM